MRKAFHLHIRGNGWPQYSFSKLNHLLAAFGSPYNRLFLRDLGKFPRPRLRGIEYALSY